MLCSKGIEILDGAVSQGSFAGLWMVASRRLSFGRFASEFSGKYIVSMEF